jgi:hypothetical protein
MAKRRLMTLLTDFGTRDPYVAAMKGVVLQGCPAAEFVDISHDVPPHDVLAAALILGHSAPFFPPDTLHVVVVDPEVGTRRWILAGRFGGQTFLFPDNGVISVVSAKMPLEALAIVRSTQHLPGLRPSATFHGRDIFAPVAAMILNGLDIHRLGPPPDTYKLLDIPVPSRHGEGVTGQVIYVDRFGNLISNIPERIVRERFDPDLVRVTCAGRDVGALHVSYGFVPKGAPLALLNSMGLVEVAVNQGRACETFNAGVGAEVTISARQGPRGS